MKRIVTLVAAVALILGLAATASAELAVKAAGAWRVHGNVLSNFGDFSDDASDTFGDTFTVQQRMRTGLRFVYNENVMGELYTEYGSHTWGQGPLAYGNTTGAGSLNVKRAFIQFRLPDTDVLTTVGEQDVTFPSSGAFSTMVVGGEDAGAIAVSTPITDMIGLTVAYTRLYENNALTSHNDADAFLAAVPVTLDGMSIAPWGAYAMVGQNAVDNDTDTAGFQSAPDDVNIWWVGAGFNMDMLDPIVIYADFVYGSANSDTSALETSGFLIDAMVEFKGLDFATLQGFAAYSSQNDDGDGAMPSIRSDWGIGGTLINGSNFTTDFGAATPGFWLVGAAARNIQFIDKLSHEVIALYAKGTNDTNGGFLTFEDAAGNDFSLTSDDSYWEVDLNTRYQMYESLAAIVELTYANFDADAGDTDPLMKAAFGFAYSF